jgi:hypothetical protein
MNHNDELRYAGAICCILGGYNSLADGINDSNYTHLLIEQLENLFEESKKKGLTEIIKKYEERSLSSLKELELKQKEQQK